MSKIILNPINHYVDAIVSILLFIFINFGSYYLFTVKESVFDSSAKGWLIFLSILTLQLFVWVLLFAYRLYETDKDFVLINIFGKKVRLAKTEIQVTIPILRLFYYLKLESGRRFILWNHMGRIDKLKLKESRH